ncbi:MAG: RICIN domain-containing protein, partial [Kiritimatiellales bacterium]
CLVDGRKPCTPNQLWEIVNGTSIRNAQAELWLGADAEGNLVLKKTGDEENRHWDIAHTDECYSSIRNVATGKFLDVSAKGFLSATKLDAKFEVIFKSFEFAPFVPGKTSRAPIKYTYGDFARVASVSYLKEGSVELEPCLSSVPELK